MPLASNHVIADPASLSRLWRRVGRSVSHACVHVCITFCVHAEEEQVLITNHTDDNDPFFELHEITVTSSEITVWGYRSKKLTREIIQHDNRKWTTLFLDYTVSDTDYEFTYMLDNDHKLQGNFAFENGGVFEEGFQVGGRSDGTHFLTGAIHALELYYTPVNKPIPQSLKQLLIKGQLVQN